MPEDNIPEKHRGKSAKEILEERRREAKDDIEQSGKCDCND